jgi:DUF1009 family protein
MGKRLGIIASSGEIPSLIREKAQEKGYTCVVAAIKGHAISSALKDVEPIQWFDLGDVNGIVTYFEAEGASEIILAGKIDPKVIFEKKKLNPSALLFLDKGVDKRPTSIIQKIITLFENKNLSVIDPTPFLYSFFCEEGILTDTRPSENARSDITFGWGIAKNIAEADIGQTVVVKNGAIVAVEGMEGTDEAIKRAGRLAGKGTTVVKVSRKNQDPRIDLPAVGLATVKSLVEARSSGLCIEADRMPFFQRQEAISLADMYGISIVAK